MTAWIEDKLELVGSGIVFPVNVVNIGFFTIIPCDWEQTPDMVNLPSDPEVVKFRSGRSALYMFAPSRGLFLPSVTMPFNTCLSHSQTQSLFLLPCSHGVVHARIKWSWTQNGTQWKNLKSLHGDLFIWPMVKESKVMKVQILFNEGSNCEQTYGKTDNANVLVLVYHQTESTVTSLSDLWLWGQRSKKFNYGSNLEINHHMLSIWYKCKLHRPNWVNIGVTWIKLCLDEGTLGEFMKLGSKVI